MSLHFIVAIMMFALGLYCLLCKRNLIKMVIGLAVMTDGIHLLLISIGYREGGWAAIFTGESLPDVGTFAAGAVDPVPQALVLTSIVINICIVALALSLAIHAHHHYGTLDPNKIKRLKD